MVRLLAVAAAATLVAAPLSAQRRSYSLDDLSFLVGCWEGGAGDVLMKEQWTSAEGETAFGVTRFLREGALVDYEFQRLVEDETGVTLWPYPRGTMSEHGFPLVRIEGDDYVFENLEHDFPVRIVYRRVGGDRVEPRIEGRDGRATGWVLERVACPG